MGEKDSIYPCAAKPLDHRLRGCIVQQQILFVYAGDGYKFRIVAHQCRIERISDLMGAFFQKSVASRGGNADDYFCFHVLYMQSFRMLSTSSLFRIL